MQGGIIMSVSQSIGKNIVALRKSKGMTQEKLALETDMSVTNLRNIERGRANPTIKSLERIAETLNEPFIKIIDFNETDDSYE